MATKVVGVVRGAFRNKVQCLNNMNMVIVRKKLIFKGFSSLTRRVQHCHSKYSIYHL
jgi:hypothetical protein